MLYKPKFCCNCGEKIQRIEWNLLTSRRFCEVCSAENRKYDVLPRIAVGGGLLAAVFGFGSFFGSSNREEAPRMTSSPVQIRSSVPKDIPSEERSQAVQPAAPVLQPPASTIENVPADQRQFPSKTGPAAAYFCGATTKKGTPCSRRVKNAGFRCFQHQAKPAALPEN